MRNLLMFTSLNTSVPFTSNNYTIVRKEKKRQLRKQNFKPVTSLAVCSFSSTWQKQSTEQAEFLFDIKSILFRHRCWFQVSKTGQHHFWNSTENTESFSCQDVAESICLEHFIFVESACHNLRANATTEKSQLSRSFRSSGYARQRERSIFSVL